MLGLVCTHQTRMRWSSETSIQWNSLGLEGNFGANGRGTVIRIYFIKLSSINRNKIKVIFEGKTHHFPTFLPTRLLGIFSSVPHISQVERFLLVFLLMFLCACTDICWYNLMRLFLFIALYIVLSMSTWFWTNNNALSLEEATSPSL